MVIFSLNLDVETFGEDMIQYIVGYEEVSTDDVMSPYFHLQIFV
jgi:hypothetical protein